jgi:hypothetical protein
MDSHLNSNCRIWASLTHRRTFALYWQQEETFTLQSSISSVEAAYDECCSTSKCRAYFHAIFWLLEISEVFSSYVASMYCQLCIYFKAQTCRTGETICMKIEPVDGVILVYMHNVAASNKCKSQERAHMSQVYSSSEESS